MQKVYDKMSITKDLFEFVKRDSDGLYSLSISENGKTETFKRILANDTNNIYSVSKVFTVTAIGFLADAGLLSLDEILFLLVFHLEGLNRLHFSLFFEFRELNLFVFLLNLLA